MATSLECRTLICASLMVIAIPIETSGETSAPSSTYDSAYAARMAAKVPPHLMGFLPDTLKAVHAREVSRDRTGYEGRWAAGQPEFYISDVDTVAVGPDTVLWLLFSDGQSAQLSPVRLRGGTPVSLACDCTRADGLVFARLKDAQTDVNGDSRPDLIVLRDGHRHYAHYSAYLWLGDSVAYAGAFSTAGRDYELRDLTGDGILEVIAGEDDPAGSWQHRDVRDVVYQMVSGKYQVSDSLSAWWRAKQE